MPAHLPEQGIRKYLDDVDIVRRTAAWLFVLVVGTGAAALFTSDDLTDRYVPLLVVLGAISGVCWLSLTVKRQYRLSIVRVDSQGPTTEKASVRAFAPTNDPGGLPAVLERHKAKGELLAEGLQSASSFLEKRRLEAEVDAWERAAYADLTRFADMRPFRGSREIDGDMTPPLVFRPTNVRDLESHLHEDPDGLRPGSDPVRAFLDTKLWWLKLMIGPDDNADLTRQRTSLFGRVAAPRVTTGLFVVTSRSG
jgi:hypothetical protein